MDVQEIRTQFYIAVDSPNRWQRLSQLLRMIKTEKALIIYEAFAGVFKDSSRPDRRYEDQEAAAGMLWKLKPKCRIDLKDEIRSIIMHYNLSIEELPWYYAQMFGVDEVRQAVTHILQEEIFSLEEKNLETWLYWLSGNPDIMKKKSSK